MYMYHYIAIIYYWGQHFLHSQSDSTANNMILVNLFDNNNTVYASSLLL